MAAPGGYGIDPPRPVAAPLGLAAYGEAQPNASDNDAGTPVPPIAGVIVHPQSRRAPTVYLSYADSVILQVVRPGPGTTVYLYYAPKPAMFHAPMYQPVLAPLLRASRVIPGANDDDMAVVVLRGLSPNTEYWVRQDLRNEVGHAGGHYGPIRTATSGVGDVMERCLAEGRQREARHARRLTQRVQALEKVHQDSEAAHEAFRTQAIGARLEAQREVDRLTQEASLQAAQHGRTLAVRDARIRELTGKLTTRDAELASLQERLRVPDRTGSAVEAALEQQVDQLTARLRDVELDLTQQREALMGAVEDAHGEMAASQKLVQALQLERDSLAAELEQSRAEERHAKQQLAALAASSVPRSEADALCAQLAAAEQALAQSREATASLNDEIYALRMAAHSSSSTFDELERLRSELEAAEQWRRQVTAERAKEEEYWTSLQASWDDTLAKEQGISRRLNERCSLLLREVEALRKRAVAVPPFFLPRTSHSTDEAFRTAAATVRAKVGASPPPALDAARYMGTPASASDARLRRAVLERRVADEHNAALMQDLTRHHAELVTVRAENKLLQARLRAAEGAAPVVDSAADGSVGRSPASARRVLEATCASNDEELHRMSVALAAATERATACAAAEEQVRAELADAQAAWSAERVRLQVEIEALVQQVKQVAVERDVALASAADTGGLVVNDADQRAAVLAGELELANIELARVREELRASNVDRDTTANDLRSMEHALWTCSRQLERAQEKLRLASQDFEQYFVRPVLFGGAPDADTKVMFYIALREQGFPHDTAVEAIRINPTDAYDQTLFCAAASTQRK